MAKNWYFPSTPGSPGNPLRIEKEKKAENYYVNTENVVMVTLNLLYGVIIWH